MGRFPRLVLIKAVSSSTMCKVPEVEGPCLLGTLIIQYHMIICILYVCFYAESRDDRIYIYILHILYLKTPGIQIPPEGPGFARLKRSSQHSNRCPDYRCDTINWRHAHYLTGVSERYCERQRCPCSYRSHWNRVSGICNWNWKLQFGIPF